MKLSFLSFFAATLALAPLPVSAQTYAYDAAGRLTSVDYGCGVVTTYSYDPGGNITQIETAGGAPAIYCTAKVNSCGSIPAIGFAGCASATAGSGFTVSATNTKGMKPGLLVYTNSGPGNAPFSGGILCVNTQPLKRSTVVFDTTGTPGQCDGTLSIDMNAFAVGALGGNPLLSLTVPGTRINCQFWARDTTTSALLSDALEYYVGS